MPSASASSRKSITSGRMIVACAVRDVRGDASRCRAASGSEAGRTRAASRSARWPSSAPKNHISRYGNCPCTRSSGQNVENWNQRVTSSRHSSTSSGRGSRCDHLRGTAKPPTSVVHHGMPESAKLRPAGICFRRLSQSDGDVARPGRGGVALDARERRARQDEDALVGVGGALALVDRLAVHAARRRSPCARPSRARSGASPP